MLETCFLCAHTLWWKKTPLTQHRDSVTVRLLQFYLPQVFSLLFTIPKEMMNSWVSCMPSAWAGIQILACRFVVRNTSSSAGTKRDSNDGKIFLSLFVSFFLSYFFSRVKVLLPAQACTQVLWCQPTPHQPLPHCGLKSEILATSSSSWRVQHMGFTTYFRWEENTVKYTVKNYCVLTKLCTFLYDRKKMEERYLVDKCSISQLHASFTLSLTANVFLHLFHLKAFQIPVAIVYRSFYW